MNRFTAKMKAKSDGELRRIIASKDLFQPEAVLAAVAELEVRTSREEFHSLKTEIETSIETNVHEKVAREGEIALIPSGLIIMSGFVFSPIMSVILFNINLWRVNKKNAVLICSSLAVILTTSEILVVAFLPYPIFFIIVINVGFGVLLTDVYWKYFVANEITHLNFRE